MLSEVCDQDDNGHNDSNSNEIPNHHRDDVLGVSPQEGTKVGTMKSHALHVGLISTRITHLTSSHKHLQLHFCPRMPSCLKSAALSKAKLPHGQM